MKRWGIAAILALLIVACLGVASASAETPTPITPDICSGVNPLHVDAESAPVLLSGSKATAPITYHTDINEAAAQLREGLENREAVISVGYKTSDSYIGVNRIMFDLAMEHTGVPTQGDYLLWHYRTRYLKTTGYESEGVYYCTITATMTYYTNAQQEAAMDRAVDSLLSQLDVNNASDYEKICAVYDFLCQNITYDYDGLESGNYMIYTAYAALIDRSAVCQGYANLFYRLALELGVDARLISGIGNGGAHGWNIVGLSGKYYNLDATWDASLVQDGLPYEYFLKCDTNFDDHTRDEEYDTVTFYNAYPMAAEDYTEIASGDCGANMQWNLNNDGLLSISGTGAMFNYSYESKETIPPWDEVCHEIKKVVIGEGVTGIGNHAFAYCSNLHDITIPNSVTRIGEAAFTGCSSLAGVTLSENITCIAPNTFYECISLTEITIPDKVTSIGECAFFYCTSLADITLPSRMTYIGNHAFSNCSMTSITLPEDLTRIENGTFNWCPNLTSVLIPDTVTSIGDYAFVGCENLKKVTLPVSLTELGVGAFADCNSLADVYYGGTEEQWSVIVMAEDNGYFATLNIHYKEPVADGWQLEDDKWVYYENGEKVTNDWRLDSKGWCYLAKDGTMATNEWIKDSVGWCYVGANGYCKTSCWQLDSKGWCYLDAEGRMATNEWIKDSQGWCYVGKDGYCITNQWMKDSIGWCYLDANGRMVYNQWVKDSVGWCYVGSTGYMVTNSWVMDSVGWCYIGADGYAVTNCWKQDSVGWCYLDSEGSMVKNDWVYDNGWYWLDGNGYMIYSTSCYIGNKTYHFNVSGLCTNP